MRFVSVIAVLLCTTPLELAAKRPAHDQKQLATNPDQSSTSNARNFKTDLQRMRALLGQMQRNVAFVSPGDTPLKHQLQMEIDMWQLLLTDMEKNSREQSPQ